MLHTQIENEEILERYVRNRLAPEERHAFEEHFMGCEECFDKLQTMERFVTGMRDAAEHGMLQADAGDGFAIESGAWFRWAFAATALLALLLAALTGWTYLVRVPGIAAERDRIAAQLQEERRARENVQPPATPVEQAEANIPLILLQASRASDEPASALLQPTDKRVVLWIEMSHSRYKDFRLEVFSTDDRLITAVDHLQLGAYGALAASLPTDQLPTGDFHIRLTGQDPPPASVAGEYRLRIRRR